MTIETKIRKIGNSYGIVLPKEALNQLKVKEGDPIYLTEAPDMSFRITSTKDSFVDMIAIAEDGMNRYKNALRELAK